MTEISPIKLKKLKLISLILIILLLIFTVIESLFLIYNVSALNRTIGIYFLVLFPIVIYVSCTISYALSSHKERIVFICHADTIKSIKLCTFGLLFPPYIGLAFTPYIDFMQSIGGYTTAWRDVQYYYFTATLYVIIICCIRFTTFLITQCKSTSDLPDNKSNDNYQNLMV